MKKFKDFGIKPAIKNFTGDKIKMSKILNKEIVVHDFRIEDSKCYQDRGLGKCLHMQISLNEVKHVIFTSARGLIDAIQQIPVSEFPFTATIIEENERFEFS